MRSRMKIENQVQAEAMQIIGSVLFERLAIDNAVGFTKLLKEWREVIESYEATHSGKIPSGHDIAWIIGVHHSMPPVELVKGLLAGRKFEELYNNK